MDNEGIEIVALHVLPRPFGCSFLTTNNQQMRTKRSTTELIARQKGPMSVTFYINPFFSAESIKFMSEQRDFRSCSGQMICVEIFSCVKIDHGCFHPAVGE